MNVSDIMDALQAGIDALDDDEDVLELKVLNIEPEYELLIRRACERTPVWSPCGGCDEYWCNLHAMHVWQCSCPPIEAWRIDPYTTPARILAAWLAGQMSSVPRGSRH